MGKWGLQVSLLIAQWDGHRMDGTSVVNEAWDEMQRRWAAEVSAALTPSMENLHSQALIYAFLATTEKQLVLLQPFFDSFSSMWWKP